MFDWNEPASLLWLRNYCRWIFLAHGVPPEVEGQSLKRRRLLQKLLGLLSSGPGTRCTSQTSCLSTPGVTAASVANRFFFALSLSPFSFVSAFISRLGSTTFGLFARSLVATLTAACRKPRQRVSHPSSEIYKSVTASKGNP